MGLIEESDQCAHGEGRKDGKDDPVVRKGRGREDSFPRQRLIEDPRDRGSKANKQIETHQEINPVNVSFLSLKRAKISGIYSFCLYSGTQKKIVWINRSKPYGLHCEGGN